MLPLISRTRAYVQYLAQDTRMFNYEIRLYNSAGC